MPSTQGGVALEVDTPFSFCDGEPVSLYVLQHGDSIIVSDNGDTIAHLMGAGLQMTHKRSWGVIRSRIEHHNLMLTDEGEIKTLGSRSHASSVLSQYLAGIMAIVDYERQSLAAPTDANVLADEVEMLFRAWRPGDDVIRNPQVPGISRRKHAFDFQIGRTLVDAVAPNAAAIGGVMRKAGDVCSSPHLNGLEVMVVIDDRDDPVAAHMEKDITTALVKTMLLTDLEHVAHRHRSEH